MLNNAKVHFALKYTVLIRFWRVCVLSVNYQLVTWCFTPSQPVQVYQGDDSQEVSNLVFYAQSTIAAV